jgi:hypothetical protein
MILFKSSIFLIIQKTIDNYFIHYHQEFQLYEH